jgi:hypothetical protein
MKKVIGVLFVGIILLALGIEGIQAQDLTWGNPIRIDLSPNLVQIAADPTTGGVFGVDTSGAVKRDFTGATPVAGLSSSVSAEGKGIAVDLNGQVYLFADGVIKSYDPTTETSAALLEQPLLPLAPDNAGKYLSITAGRGGKIFVLYEATSSGKQYVLTGNPAPVSEGVVIRFSPRALNLSSHGNWVTCSIDLPDGTDEHDIDLGTIKIVKISVQDPNPPIDEEVAEIPCASNSKSTVTSGNGKLIVKFPLYDKKQPDNPLSLVGKLREVLNEQSDGFYQVTLSVEVELSTTGEKFIGTDEIRVKLRN